MEKKKTDIYLDLDRDRIKTVLHETYDTAEDLLDTTFDLSIEEFVAQIDPYLDSNRVSVPVQIRLPSKKYPQLHIEVDLRRGKVFARIPSHARNHPKQVLLNRYLKVL